MGRFLAAAGLPWSFGHSMIKLTSLIKLADVDLGKYKIHCAVDDNRGTWRPLDAYFAGTFEWGQARQKNENFNRAKVVSLTRMANASL